MSLWRELRRRHIFRIAAVYAATAWLVLQLGAIVFPALHAPGWCLPVLIGFVALGFPVALVLAWAFEVTPDGVRRTESAGPGATAPGGDRRGVGQILNVAIMVILAAAVGVLTWRLTARNQSAARPQAATIQSPAPSTAIPAKSIAVLPFENLSTDKSNAFFADGMQDLILTKLADIGDLKVISRTSTLQYGSHPQNLRSIAKQLGVATILEGSVQKSGDQVLINVQLIDAHDDSHLWGKSYMRTLKDIFGVEGDVAQRIADALDAKLTVPERHRLAATPTASPAAKEAYIRGRALMSSGSTDRNVEKAAAAYRRAVALDPEFGIAWAALADNESRLYQDHVGDRRAHLASAREALDKAKSLAPEAAQTQLAIANIRIATRLDFRGAMTALQRAAARAPGNAEVMLRMARVQEALGHWKEAVDYARRAVTINPLDRATLARAAEIFIDVRDFGHALALANRMLAIQADDSLAIATKAFVYQEQGRFAAAGKLLAHLDFSQPGTPHTRAFRIALRQKFLTHDYAGILRMLHPLLGPASSLGPDWKVVFRPMLARAELLSGQSDAARKTFEAQAAAVRKMMREPGESDPYSQAVAQFMLGQAEAGLGHKSAALAAGRKAVALDSENRDAAGGRELLEPLAAIEAQTGDLGAAVALLHHLLAVPYFEPVTAPILRADPRWNPLRKDPAFQALLEKYPVSPASSIDTATTGP